MNRLLKQWKALVAVCYLMASVAPAVADGRSAKFNYLLRCSGCHDQDGTGLPSAGIPALPGYIDAFAGDDEGRTYIAHVPGVVATGLTDVEIAAVLNYVIDRWGDPKTVEPFTEAEVKKRRAEPVSDVVAYRRRIVERLKTSGVKIADYPWP
ncbi:MULTISPECIES: c-type cytochrome [Alphaproteobacteria]|uniref:Cytochrome c-552 n=2 Tax=Alphaproteobacteria TaxID=28211 RepID=A0A512HF79_9HYPH|nr:MULTISPECIES: hypothetical protein [Alphaproteobacteria]GEO84124.1 cytochrome c-552 [Ciceribacter naphthalenivorans]GLR24660.1 cytochrome c-552 [Ciceribacter naphthalenivorans]GLT07516.1 cytochrome c-552 [Sphingomonas psychrolutea]